MRIKFIYIIFLGLMFAGCTQEEPKYKNLLNLNEVTAAFKSADSPLIQSNETISHELSINGINPSVFKINSYSKDKLFVYVFPDFDARKKGEKEYLTKTSLFGAYLHEDVGQPVLYRTKNVLLVLTNKEIPLRNTRKLPVVLINYLNEGRVRVYEGRSQNWEAVAKYNFYETWVKERDDRLDYDSHCIHEIILRYTGNNIANTGNIEYEYRGKRIGGHGERPFSKNDIYLDSGSGEKGVPLEDDIFIINVNFNGHQEEIELKLKK